MIETMNSMNIGTSGDPKIKEAMELLEKSLAVSESCKIAGFVTSDKGVGIGFHIHPAITANPELLRAFMAELSLIVLGFALDG